MSKLKEPLPIFIETGYMIASLVEHVDRETNRIIEHIREAVRQARSKGDEIQDIDFAEPLERLYNLLAAAHGAKHAHKILSDLLISLGYRAISVEDFKKYGVTRR